MGLGQQAGGLMQQHDGFAYFVLALEQRGAGLPSHVQRQFFEGLLGHVGGLAEDRRALPRASAAHPGCARAASRLALAMSAESAVAQRINRSPVAGSMIHCSRPDAGTQSPLKTHSDSITWDNRWLLDADI